MSGFGHVWTAAESFRRSYLAGQEDRLPVDVFTVIELRLRLDVIPFDDLAAKYGIEAALLPDFTGLYVDAESYVFWERGPVWKQNRLRFSVAHELGHYVLHREVAARIKFRSFDEFARHFKANDGPKYMLKQEANEFAGRLLVPIERLQAFYDAFAVQIRDIVPGWRTVSELRQKFAESVAPKFGVHPDAILTRLDREGLWPGQQ